ncbi:Ig-like domain-containing protein, partial [Pseudomonas sp. HMWF021]|uniref:Ig-like domain-containing protein n=1 Tax=Pseudomonas sp. HMWF021 TaxID=2056857 RepID=UPI000D406D94
MSAPILFSPLNKTEPKNKPVFIGKGTPGTEIIVCQSVTGLQLARVLVDSNGSWLVQSAVELPEGDYSISAYPAGTYEYAPNTPFYVGTKTGSEPTSVLTDGTPPVITTPANGSSLPTLRPTFTGKAAPNARIGVFNDNLQGYYGDCYADANGDWSFTPKQDMSAGSATYKFAQYSNVARMSADTAITLTLRGSNALPSGSAPVLTSPTTVNTPFPLLKGKAAANAVVYVYLEGGAVLFGKPTANADG